MRANISKWYFGTVGRYTGRTILNNVFHFGCNGVVLLPSKSTLTTAQEISEKLREITLGLEIYFVELKTVKLWYNVNEILKKVYEIASKNERPIIATFDISGGTRIMTIAAHVAASLVATTKLVKETNIIYTFEDESKKGQENPFTTEYMPQIKIAIITRREKTAILNALKVGALSFKKLEIAVKGAYRESKKGPAGSFYEHIDELEKYGLVEKKRGKKPWKIKLTDEGKAFLEIVNFMNEYSSKK